MATWYIKGQTGDDPTGEVDNPAKPFQTYTACIAAGAVGGDIFFFSEQCDEQINVLTGIDDDLLRTRYYQWPGQTPAVIDGGGSRSWGIRASSKTNFIVDGLICQNATLAGIEVSSVITGAILITNSNFTLNANRGIYIPTINGAAISIVDCYASLNSYAGIYINSMASGSILVSGGEYTDQLWVNNHAGGSITFDSVEVHDTGGNGMYFSIISGGVLSITDNQCYGCAYGVYFNGISGNPTVTLGGNIIHLNTLHGIYFNGMTGGDANVLRNVLYGNIQRGIYTNTITGADSFYIQYNKLIKNATTGSLIGNIEFYNSQNINVYRNTIYGLKSNDYGIRLLDVSCTGINLNSNIISHCRYGIRSIVYLDINYCCAYDNESNTLNDATTAWAAGTGNITTDPEFTNPATDDYTLQTTSPCKDTGDPSPPAWASTTDLAGNPCPVGVSDMGCYEFQAVGGSSRSFGGEFGGLFGGGLR